MQIITTAIIKGGTGKSTTAAALAQAGAAAGKKILAIDLDPQANLTSFIGADQDTGGSFQILHGADPAGVIQHTDQGIDILTASPDLATEKTAAASAKRLHNAIDPLRPEYDLIIIDTPPQMGELTFNALQAADGLIIPLETDSSSLQGLYQVVDIAKQIRRSNPNLTIIGTILTRFDGRPKINKYLQEVITDKGKEIGAPFLLPIRSGIAIREAQALQTSLYKYAPGSNPAKDYMKLFNIIEEMF